MSTLSQQPYRRVPLPTVLGEDPVIRAQVYGVLFSAGTYVLYGGITAVMVATGLVHGTVGLLITLAGLLANAGFYAWVRSGRARAGRDPGLGSTQLYVGVGFMYIGYAAMGPAATAALVSMASHVVYSMFSMTPRQVWRLVGLSLAGLALTMLACQGLWPDRFRPEVQLTSFLFAALVIPLIALLADKITKMTQDLKSQQAALQEALARLNELATRDELTRTHNRRHMAELLLAQQAHHQRLGQPLSLALLDIDHFKQVNDRLGHATGDEVLRRFAQVTQAQLRAGDQLARWGGEEFLVLMPNTEPADGLVAMDRLQQRLATLPPDTMPAGLVVAFSGGVTALRPGERPDAAIERADQAMYRAKTSGRARCLLG